MLMGSSARSGELCEQALAVARAVGAWPAEVRALATLGADVAYLGDSRAGSAAARCRARRHEVGDPTCWPRRRSRCRTCCAATGGSRRPWRWGSRAPRRPTARASARRRGPSSALNCSEAAFELGRWDIVERVVDDILAERRATPPSAPRTSSGALLAAVRGDFEAATRAGARCAAPQP